jgi:lipopolysaccharide transport system ATP-binding protein
MLCFGNTNEVVEAYYSKFVQNQQEIISPALVGKEAPAKIDLNYDLIDKNDDFKQRALFKRIQNGKAEFVNVQLLDINGNVISQVDFGQIVVLRMLVNVKIDLPLLGLAYHIRDKNGFDLVYSDTGIDNCHISNSSAGILFVINWKFKVTLREGDYTIAAMASIPKDLNIGLVEVCDFVPIAYQFKVHKGYKFPIYGAVYWENKITFSIIGSDGIVVPAEERKI